MLLATIDYLQERSGGSFVYDQCDPVTEYHQQQKLLAAKYFKQRRLDRLQQRFKSLTRGLQDSTGLAFASYIKEKTGYEIDIFEDLRKRVAAIIAQNEIRSEKELGDIGTMIRIYHETAPDGEDIGKLSALLTSYVQQEQKASAKRKSRYSEVTSIVEKEGMSIMSVTISTGPKPKHFEEQVIVSPDEKRRLRIVEWDGGKYASTCVTVEFPTASGAVYAINGIQHGIKAWWKDNSTIVIETSKEYKANAKHNQVRSFEDTINIEYIES